MEQKPNAYYLLGKNCNLMLGMRFPWSDWPPRRKAEVLILFFVSFIVGLRVYSAFCSYVHDTLYYAIKPIYPRDRERIDHKMAYEANHYSKHQD